MARKSFSNYLASVSPVIGEPSTVNYNSTTAIDWSNTTSINGSANMDSQTRTFPDTIAKNGSDMYVYSTDPIYASFPQDQSVLVSQFTAPVSKQVRKHDRPVLATTSAWWWWWFYPTHS